MIHQQISKPSDRGCNPGEKKERDMCKVCPSDLLLSSLSGRLAAQYQTCYTFNLLHGPHTDGLPSQLRLATLIVQHKL